MKVIKTKKSVGIKFIVATYPPTVSSVAHPDTFTAEDEGKANQRFDEKTKILGIKAVILKDVDTGKIIRHFSAGKELLVISTPKPTIGSFRDTWSKPEKVTNKPNKTIKGLRKMENYLFPGTPGLNSNF